MTPSSSRPPDSLVAPDAPASVLQYLRTKGPARARDIANNLGFDRSEVNKLLYGPLKDQVSQDRDFAWSTKAIGDGASHKTGARSPVGSSSWAGLFGYYLDCLSQDDDSGVSVFAESRFDLDYVELTNWPLESAAGAADNEPLRKLLARLRQDKAKKVLWLGYPVMLRQARARNGWVGTFVEPLLLWPQDPDGGELDFLPAPLVNTNALRGLVGRDDALDESALLAEQLSLDSSDPPPLDELVARLRALREGWPWRESLLPAPLHQVGSLRRLTEPGLYNAAVAILADRSPFTVGLERELAELRNRPDGSLETSSLGVLLGKPGPRLDDQTVLLEPAPLNTEQRTAVREALTAPLTVITGPPGTGKSQVVASILVNAAWRGLRVLFASKNHKAVDVVFNRVNGLAQRPTLLRLGTRALHEQLAQHLSALLSSRPTDEDRLAYEASLVDLRGQGEALELRHKSYEELVALRNRVDRLEQAAEAARKALPDAAFRDPARLQTAELSRRIEALRAALQRADREKASLVVRLTWALRQKNLGRTVDKAAASLIAHLSAIGLDSNLPSEADRLLIHAKPLLESARLAAEYHEALNTLASQSDVGALSKGIAHATARMADLSIEAWRAWTRSEERRVGKECED